MAPPKHFTGLRPLLANSLQPVSASILQGRANLVDKLKPLVLGAEFPSNGAPSLAKLWPDLQQTTWRLLATSTLPRTLANVQLLAEKFDAVAGTIAVCSCSL